MEIPSSSESASTFHDITVKPKETDSNNKIAKTPSISDVSIASIPGKTHQQEKGLHVFKIVLSVYLPHKLIIFKVC